MSPEALIQSLLKDLGKPPVHAEGVSPPDLGNMAHMIATAMQGVGTDLELHGAEKGVPGKPEEAMQGGDSPPGEPLSLGYGGRWGWGVCHDAVLCRAWLTRP